MFEQALLTPREEFRISRGGVFDYGHLAETLVFYDHVALVGSSNDLCSLIRDVGAEGFRQLQEDGRLSLLPVGVGIAELSTTDSVSLTALDWHVEKLDRLADALRSNPLTAHHAVAIMDNIEASDTLVRASATSVREANRAVSQQLGQDAHFLRQIARSLLYVHNPTESHKVRDSGTGVEVDSSLGTGVRFGWDDDPWAADEFRPFNSSGLFHEIARCVSWLAAGRLLTADLSLHADLARGFSTHLEERAAPLFGNRQVALFQEVRYGSTKAIGMPVSKAQSFEERHQRFLELVLLLREKERFSSWLREQPPNAVVVKEYFDYLKAGTWVDRLPGKISRFSFFTGAGILVDAGLALATGVAGVGIAGGVLLGAFDAFLFDHIRDGWKPNYFIDGPLADWIEKGNKGDPSQVGKPH